MKIRLLTAQELLKHFPLVNEDKESLTILVHGKSMMVGKRHLGCVFDVIEIIEGTSSVKIMLEDLEITIPVWGYSFVNEDGEDVLLDSDTSTVKKGRADNIQYGGDHYNKMKVQVWDIVDDGEIEQSIGYYRWNAVKYLKRMGTKDSRLQEAQKALHYAQKLVEVLESIK